MYLYCVLGERSNTRSDPRALLENGRFGHGLSGPSLVRVWKGGICWLSYPSLGFMTSTMRNPSVLYMSFPKGRTFKAKAAELN